MAKINEINSGTNRSRVKSKDGVSRSTFPMSKPFPMTYRFGEYGINMVVDVEGNDQWNVAIPSNAFSYTMKAPLQSDVALRKEMFFVPMTAILPRNWEKIDVNPTKGDDIINNPDVNTTIFGFYSIIRNKFLGIKQATEGAFSDTTVTVAEWYERVFKTLIYGEMFYSAGSLVNAMGCHMHNLFTHGTNNNPHVKNNYGRWFDTIISQIFTSQGEITVSNLSGMQTVKVTNNTNGDARTGYIDVRTFLALARDEWNWSITATLGNSKDQAVVNELRNGSITTIDDTDIVFNYRRLCAYQIACAHFFTNDKIDYVYTAELYRQLMGNYIDSFNGYENFQYNGITYQYDNLSSKYLKEAINISNLLNNTYDNIQYSYLRHIFGYNRSLRFKDYFTGARSNPMAVGDVNVQVNNGFVNVVDTVRKTQLFKFLTATNRIGQREEDYEHMMTGANMKPDYAHNPLWLARTKDLIKAIEMEGTDSGMLNSDLSLRSRFSTGTNSKTYDIKLDRKGILLSIVWFDIPRVYTTTVDRFFFHENRFDDFNKYLQYTGDQKIYLGELDIRNLDNKTPFAYTGAYEEYKSMYPEAAGGFVDDLPGYIFKADNGIFKGGFVSHIGPNFIRSLCTELDEFYNSLTGYSMNTYFHFMLINYNQITAKRSMAYNPGISG